MENLTAFAQALADGTRWRIVRLVFDEPMCVCELADILGMPQSSVSTHIQIIRKSGMLENERRGKWIYYRLARKYRPLLQTVAGLFGISPEGERLLKSDAERASGRMAVREQSCCPPPKGLASLKPLKPKGTPAGAVATKGGAP